VVRQLHTGLGPNGIVGGYPVARPFTCGVRKLEKP
jgi:hypothetical protein